MHEYCIGEELIPIRNTLFAELFDKSSLDIFLLPGKCATRIWNQFVDDKADSYFRMGDSSWIVKAENERRIIGEWMKSFNDENILPIETSLKRNINWQPQELVWFCVNKATVMETTWDTFTKKWISFLYCDDDCPIVINRRYLRECILFTPTGDIYFISAG
jgi:DUF2947 family protein